MILYNDIGKLGADLWDKTTGLEGFGVTPRIMSAMLFKRLWSNQRGFTTLWNQGLKLEADIILRSAIEVAICLAANFQLQEGFVTLMRQDAAHSIQGQIKLHRSEGMTELVPLGEETLRGIQSGFPDGIKAARLDWKALAEQGKVAQLYTHHRRLSGVSSHVTGLSMLRTVTTQGIEAGQAELDSIEPRMNLMMMAGAMLQGSLLHAGMLGDAGEVQRASALLDRLNTLTSAWMA